MASGKASLKQEKKRRRTAEVEDAAAGKDAPHTSKGESNQVLAQHEGFKVFSREVKAESETALLETPFELDYQAISEGKQEEWFLEHVQDLIKNDEHYPSESHGFNRVLTNIHRAHPRIVWDLAGELTPYDIHEYKSAGVWKDSEGNECLVIYAYYKEDDEYAMQLLYESERVEGRKGLKEPTNWAVLDVGTGGHLTKKKDRIICDNKCKDVTGQLHSA